VCTSTVCAQVGCVHKWGVCTSWVCSPEPCVQSWVRNAPCCHVLYATGVHINVRVCVCVCVSRVSSLYRLCMCLSMSLSLSVLRRSARVAGVSSQDHHMVNWREQAGKEFVV